LPCENGNSCELVADCQSGVCSAANTCRACVTQADCSSGFYCDGLGGCATTHSNGTMCAVGFECTSGSCIDCGSGFTCHDADDCLANGVVCDGGLQCASGNCIDGFCCNTSCGNACDACDLAGAEGNCSLVNAGLQGNPSCSPYLCSGMSELCPFRCVESFDCAQGSICVNNACAPNGS